MKRAILAKRLPHLLLGGLITGLLAVSAVVLPATPAQAADKYFYDVSYSEDLSFKDSFYAGEKEDLSEKYDTKDSEIICKKHKSEINKAIRKSANEDKKEWGISHRQVDNCRFQGSYFFLESSGKYDEKLLDLDEATSDYGLRINSNGELVLQVQILELARNIRDIPVEPDIGFARFNFPGKIKSVTPNIGKVSRNSWILEKPPTTEEQDKLEKTTEKLPLPLNAIVPSYA